MELFWGLTPIGAYAAGNRRKLTWWVGVPMCKSQTYPGSGNNTPGHQTLTAVLFPLLGHD